MARLNWRKPGQPPARPTVAPACTRTSCSGSCPTDLREPFDPREVIAGSSTAASFDEFKPLYGTALVTGWAALHGYPIGMLANAHGVLFSEEAQKAAQFIQLANQVDTPLLFLQNTTGYMVGTQYEQGGIIKDGAQMINAVSNSEVPHLTVMIGASYGAGNYGMCGRAYDPRFLFTWPSAKSAVMGPAQLAGVLSIVARQAAAGPGSGVRREADAGMRRRDEQIEAESPAVFLSGRLYDDGIIDPRDTRTVLASACRPSRTRRPGGGGGRARRPRLRGVPAVTATSDHPPAGRQPRRDRPPGLRDLPQLGIDASRSTATRTPALPYVREADSAVRLPGSAPADTYLQRACDRRGRRTPARTRSTRLRLPVRERRVRPGGRRRRPDLGRADRRSDRGDGRRRCRRSSWRRAPACRCCRCADPDIGRGRPSRCW